MVAQQASVRCLRLFHHDPRREDRELDRIEEAARQQFSACRAACEGEMVVL
jgi:phosphoribosyl 1,2-cyclic phosphodiesterase